MTQSLPHFDIAIVGAGFAGLGMAIALKQAGIDDFVILERADAVGGTWRANRYPGCGCDVPTPLYSFSFAPNPDWSHLYAHRDEIYDYLEVVTDRYELRSHIQFGRAVTGGSWDEESHRWTVDVDGERAVTARVVVGGFGGLSEPAYPDIEGLDAFTGMTVHSAVWDDRLDLTGKRVGVIGTGASAIQLVPRIAKAAGRLTVFQRTAPWVVPKIDYRITRVEKALFRRFPLTQRIVRGVIFGITEAIGYAITTRPQLLRVLEARSRRMLERQVPDPELRRRLMPQFRLGCKRILFANDYYPALTRPNVSLVTDRIERITETGVRTADGRDHEVDVLVCSTGFEIEGLVDRFAILGREGLPLSKVWSDGIEAHRGTTIHGFPNLFLLSGPNTGTGSTSQVFMIESQIRYVVSALEAMRRHDADAVEVREAAQRAYNEDLQRRMQRTIWLRGGCNSWYLDSSGVNRTLYPGLATQYRLSMRRLELDEYELTPARHG